MDAEAKDGVGIALGDGDEESVGDCFSQVKAALQILISEDSSPVETRGVLPVSLYSSPCTPRQQVILTVSGSRRVYRAYVINEISDAIERHDS